MGLTEVFENTFHDSEQVGNIKLDLTEGDFSGNILNFTHSHEF
jgi:hypothetical protein